ncbi:hypothetical protein BH09VER1_BH09VER1_42200 [soil metagenome]
MAGETSEGSLRYDNLGASARGLAEIHRDKIVLFARAADIDQVLLKFGHSSHRPILTSALGLLFIPIGAYGLIECLFSPAGFRYEIGLIALGIIGGSLIYDTLKKRYFLEVHHRKEISRLICSRHATRQGVTDFVARIEAAYQYKIAQAIPEQDGDE